MPKLPQRPPQHTQEDQSDRVGIRLRDARTGGLGPVQYATKTGSKATHNLGNINSYDGAPGAPSLHDPAKMGMIYQDLARQRAAFADGDVDPMGTKFAQSLQRKWEDRERARAQRQLQQMGSGIHGGGSQAMQQYQRAAREAAEVDIGAASEQQLLAKRAHKAQEFNSYYNNLLRGIGFEAGLQSQDFKNELTRWMQEKQFEEDEIAMWLSLIGNIGSLGVQAAT